MEKLEPYIKDLQQWAKFDDENLSRIMLTLSEAANNAIMHGNRQDPEKQVIINAQLKKCTLKISVQDEGEGFDPASLPNPLEEENLLNEGGRGVYLIKQYADDTQFSKNGTKVTITFQLDK